MSSGTFGSKIATELLKMGHEVIFFKAKDSKSPFSATIDFKSGENPFDVLTRIQSLYIDTFGGENYKEHEYRTFDEYFERLKFFVGVEQPDIVVLAAAVSDYGVENPFDGKVRSNDMLTVKLKQLPKIIYYIKEWCPKAKLVGFKLLVGSKESQLKAAAVKSITENKCDMIVANDLQDIKENNHKILLVYPDGTEKNYKSDPKNPNFLARMVAEHTVKL
jgi:phosphopantothenoylcysteine synthetase/decarboxylase